MAIPSDDARHEILSEITQRYIKDRESASWKRIREAQSFMALLERNMAQASQRILSEGEPVQRDDTLYSADPAYRVFWGSDKSDAAFQRSAAIAEEHEVAREIPVTDEMKAVGAKVALRLRSRPFDECAPTVYRAMAAVSPKQVWPAGSTGSYTTDLEQALSRSRQEQETQAGMIADLRDKLARKSEAAMRVSDDKDATIAALRAQIATFTAQNVRPVAGEEVTPTPSPFRDFLGDPRRIGGMS